MTVTHMVQPRTLHVALSVKDVAKRYGVSESTVWKWQRRGDIPRASSVGPRLKRWYLHDLLEWEATQNER